MTSPSAADLESVWAEREEIIYPQTFGRMTRGVFPLSHELFSGRLRQTDVDPRWLQHGVFEYGPTEHRRSWVYVTSGTSNPWELEPADYGGSEFSGIGTELVLETPSQSDWAVQALQQLLGYNLLLAHGRFGDVLPLDYGVRIPLGGPIDGQSSCVLRFAVVTKPAHYPARFSLPSGAVDFLHIVGVTESERDFAKLKGSDALIEKLRAAGAYPTTDPKRVPVS
jgi:hypothetical protein